MENAEVTLTPSGSCEYLIPADELGSLGELANFLESRSKREQSLFEQTLGGAFERLARGLTAAAINSATSHLDRQAMQMMAALNEFRLEACDLIEKALIRELGDEKRHCAITLCSKIKETVEQLAWPNHIRLFVNPDQMEQLDKGLTDPKLFSVSSDPTMPLGNFRLELGRTSVNYDLTQDLKLVTDTLRRQLLRGSNGH
jgi:hypothetical protein